MKYKLDESVLLSSFSVFIVNEFKRVPPRRTIILLLSLLLLLLLLLYIPLALSSSAINVLPVLSVTISNRQYFVEEENADTL